MTKVLLTGAGFSRNWGGWVAAEAFEYLLGCAQINPRISRMLWQATEKDGGGFEAVYQRLYDGARANQHPQADFDAFHSMVSGMFHTMGQGFNSGFNEDICRFLGRSMRFIPSTKIRSWSKLISRRIYSGAVQRRLFRRGKSWP
jgi:hypothetical protein